MRLGFSERSLHLYCFTVITYEFISETTFNSQFIVPTNAHSVKYVELLKHIKIMEAAPTCFGLQRNHQQGATAST